MTHQTSEEISGQGSPRAQDDQGSTPLPAERESAPEPGGDDALSFDQLPEVLSRLGYSVAVFEDLSRKSEAGGKERVSSAVNALIVAHDIVQDRKGKLRFTSPLKIVKDPSPAEPDRCLMTFYLEGSQPKTLAFRTARDALLAFHRGPVADSFTGYVLAQTFPWPKPWEESTRHCLYVKTFRPNGNTHAFMPKKRGVLFFRTEGEAKDYYSRLPASLRKVVEVTASAAPVGRIVTVFATFASKKADQSASESASDGNVVDGLEEKREAPGALPER